MNWTTETQPVARKEHRCTTCMRTIGRGETYHRQRGFDGGDAWTSKSCAHCRAVTEIYDPRDSDDLISSDGHYCWTEDQPRDWAEARAMVGFMHRWRYRSGRLMPIPAPALATKRLALTREGKTND